MTNDKDNNEPISEHYYIKEFSEGEQNSEPAQKRELGFVEGEFCMAYYPDQYNKLELFYCVIISLGANYCICDLWFDEKRTTRRGRVNDVCTPDLVKLKGQIFKPSGNSKEGSEPKADHRVINWPTREEIRARLGGGTYEYGRGVKDAIEWLSSRLQAETNTKGVSPLLAMQITELEGGLTFLKDVQDTAREIARLKAELEQRQFDLKEERNEVESRGKSITALYKQRDALKADNAKLRELIGDI